MNCKNRCQSFITGRPSWASTRDAALQSHHLAAMHMGLRKWKSWSSMMSLLPKTYISELLRPQRDNAPSVPSAERHLLSGWWFRHRPACCCWWWGGRLRRGRPASQPQCLLQGCAIPFPPNSFLFVHFAFFYFILFSCFPAFFATGHLFAMCWIKHKSHRNDFKVLSTE